MLIQADRSQLLIVDVQERLAPIVTDRDRTVRNVSILLRAAAAHGVPVTMSEQYPKGLGHTLPELAELGSRPALAKTAFSALGDPELRARILDSDRDHVIVGGIEAHVCVLQSVMDLLAEGRAVWLVADACGSRHIDSHTLGLERMRDAGACIVTTEMVVFEFLRSAEAPTFRDMSRLIR